MGLDPAVITTSTTPKLSGLAKHLLLVNIAFDVLGILDLTLIALLGNLITLAFGGHGYFSLDMLYVFVPIADTVILYKLAKRPLGTKASTYFTLSRIALVGDTIWQSWGDFTHKSATNSPINFSTATTTVGLLFYILCGLILYRTTKAAWQFWVLLIAMGAALVGIIGLNITL